MKRLLLLTTILVAGCTSTGGPSTQLQQAANDAALMVSAVGSEIQQIEILYPNVITAAGQQNIATDLAALQQAQTQLATLTNTPATGDVLQTIDEKINDIVAILAAGLNNVPACAANTDCAAAELALTALSVMLPEIEGMANALITGQLVPAPVVTGLGASSMTLDQARLVLAGVKR